MRALVTASVVIAACTLILSPAAARAMPQARSAPQRGVIDGAVTDSSLAPIEGATITIFQTPVRVSTGASGRFRIQQVPAGQYLIIVQRIGFRPASGIVEVAPDDTLRLAYTLNRAVTNLPATVVTEQRLTMKLAEFESRRQFSEKFGGGQFLTQADIEQRGSIFTPDLVRTFLGVNVKSAGPFKEFAFSTRQGNCPVEIFLDGIRQKDQTGGPVNLDDLPVPSEIAGIEMYTGPAVVPLQYAGMGTPCGVLLIWTKDGG
jgi:Carboxypeptidase regulatory-like domain/TonB-dependent Receptor Plug Domain